MILIIFQTTNNITLKKIKLKGYSNKGWGSLHIFSLESKTSSKTYSNYNLIR